MRFVILALTLGAMVVAGACSEGGGDATTLEEYFATLDQITSESRAAVEAVQTSGQAPTQVNPSDEEIVAVARDRFAPIVAALQSRSEELSAIDPPAEVDDVHKGLVDLYAKQAKLFENWYQSDGFDELVVGVAHADSREDFEAAAVFAFGDELRAAEEMEDEACDDLEAIAIAHDIEFGGC